MRRARQPPNLRFAHMVLIGVLSIAAGFRAVLTLSGAEDVAIVLRSGATDEMGSGLTQPQTRIIADAKDIARDADGVIASPELYVIVDVPLKRTGTAANVPLRGVGQQAPKLRQNFRIVEGRMAGRLQRVPAENP